MDFVERRLANTKHQRAVLFQADIGGAFDQLGRDAVGNAGQRAHAARDHDHGVGGIRAAGDVGADIGIGLLLDFA